MDKERYLGANSRSISSSLYFGFEDSILIHAAHIIFENFRITDKERKYLDQIDSATLDKEYIAYQLKKIIGEKAFLKIIRSKDRTENVDLKVIASAWVYKLVKEPGTGVYLAGKSIKIIVRHLNCKRKRSPHSCDRRQREVEKAL